jgi:hypothetical protein
MSLKCQRRTLADSSVEKFFALQLVGEARQGRTNMARFVALALAACCYFQPGITFAQDVAKRLVGTWQVTSFALRFVDNEVIRPFGDRVGGYIQSRSMLGGSGLVP